MTSILFNSIFTGSLPTVTMIMISLVVMIYDIIPTSIEPYFQNFCAGLIVGAVSIDIIPLIQYTSFANDISYSYYVLALAIGFISGIVILNFFESITESIESHDIEEIVLNTCNASKPSDLIIEMKENSVLSKFQSNDINYSACESDAEDSPAFDPEDESINLSLNALFHKTDHKTNISKNIESLIDSINSMDVMMENIINVVDQSGDVNVATRTSEELAENIDKECHILQYKLDHCRRLLQGSFTDLGNNITVDKWKDIDSRNELRKRLYNLKYIAKHLLEHMDDSNLNAAILREVHSHMHDMDHQIEKFHNTVEITAFKWKKRKELPIPQKGSIVPASLIIPVCIDAIIDGFVIGLTTAISYRAGLILGIATSMEMAFLGIAVSVRIKRCTSSLIIVRYASIIFPPLLVVIFSVIGSFIGNLSKSQSFYFIAFVSLGIYCLLNLVFDELLIEARNGFHEVPWHLNSMIFLGLFVVITLNSF